MTKKLPKTIDVGPFKIEIQILPSAISYEGNEEGSFQSRQRIIYIAEDIVERGGEDLINVLIHELLHVIYYQYNLSNSSSEEDVVNSMANGLTELLTRTALLETIKKLKR